MKWSKTPADLLPEKTFLVIREDFQTIEDKSPTYEKSSPREAVAPAQVALDCCDTWPPKMRKKRMRKTRSGMYESLDGDEPRPATASLEAPLVLDPRLIDKLDMSLLSKESLDASLTRINLGVLKTVTILESSLVKSSESLAKSPTTATSKLRARFASPPKSDTRTAATVTVTTRGTNEGASSPEVKRLDDNNNKNKSGSSSQQLSPVRSRSSRGNLSSSDVALFTTVKKKPACNLAPEPCRACGRAAQPERLHSHPKSSSPLQSPIKGPKSPKSPKSPKESLSLNSARSSPSVIPVRAATGLRSSRRTSVKPELPSPTGDKKSPLSSRLASPRSVQFSESTSSEEKVSTSEEATRKDRKLLKSATNSKLMEDKLAARRRPRSVTCYICGREFGTASFPIHEPKCLEKWQRENRTLPSAQRRKLPQRPTVPIDHEDWNVAAWEQSQALLIPCLKCKRTFQPDRLVIHERNCRVPNKGNNNNNNNNNNINNRNNNSNNINIINNNNNNINNNNININNNNNNNSNRNLQSNSNARILNKNSSNATCYNSEVASSAVAAAPTIRQVISDAAAVTATSPVPRIPVLRKVARDRQNMMQGSVSAKRSSRIAVRDKSVYNNERHVIT